MGKNTANGVSHPPKTSRGMETMQKICVAAEQLFCEKGYYEVSINDITRIAGVSAGTFYVYFESKLSLYQYLLKQYGHQIRKHISVAIDGCKTRREAEREGLKAWFEFVSKNRHVFFIIWESLYIDRALFDEYYETFSSAYTAQLKAAQKSGEVREDVDLEILSYALMGISNFIGLHWFVFKENHDADYMANEVIKIIDGIFPRENK
ncbi:MAG: TetR/AcrR family transcriptional regulator [Lachnospiraceae bacterium]|nr:TetR/AcrR family transcriptional regulator [Lachnospiraceae bacterium]